METVDEWSTYLFKLYGEAHQYHFTSHHQRITHLNIGVRALRNVARGKIEALTLPQAIARCIGRTIYVSHLFTGLPLSQALISKYGNGCRYCLQRICICKNESRPEPQLSEIVGSTNVSFRAVAQHLNETYGEKNAKQGITWTLDRLSDEITELYELEERLNKGCLPVSDARIRFADELSDVLAWIIAVANVRAIDICQALQERYGNGCHRCRNIPCFCPPRYFAPEPEK